MLFLTGLVVSLMIDWYMQQFPIIQQGDFTGADVLKNDEWMADIANLLLCCGIDFRWLFMATIYTRFNGSTFKNNEAEFPLFK